MLSNIDWVSLAIAVTIYLVWTILDTLFVQINAGYIALAIVLFHICKVWKDE